MTNFDMSRYDIKSIACSNLPIGGLNNKPKTSSESLSESKSFDGPHSDISANTYSSHPPTASTLSFGLPIKQDSANSWSNPAVFQPLHFSMNFPTNLSVNEASKNKTDQGFFNGNNCQQQEGIALNSNSSSATTAAYDGSVSTTVGNWISPSLQSFQAAKSNLSALQTPIFGME